MRLCLGGRTFWEGLLEGLHYRPGCHQVVTEEGLSLLEKGFSLSSEGRVNENSWFMLAVAIVFPRRRMHYLGHSFSGAVEMARAVALTVQTRGPDFSSC